jgi:CheY-like chemotaxis protein
MSQRTILVIEDEEKLRRVIGLHLSSAGFQVRPAGSAEEGLKYAGDADLVLTDLKLPGMDGLTLLEQLKSQNAHSPVIVMSAFGTGRERGRGDEERERSIFSQAFFAGSSVRSRRESPRGQQPASRKSRAEGSPRKALSVRQSDRQQSGHAGYFCDGSARRSHPRDRAAVRRKRGRQGHDRARNPSTFAAQGSALRQDQLHRHPRKPDGERVVRLRERRFTGANVSKPGKFEQADTGTVFLDEIGDVPGNIQVKLLRVLQEREFERLGSNRVMKTDVRVIAATNVDLRAALENGTFREDLYYRLNVVPLNIPPLRERKDDIPYLVEHFAKKFGGEISDDAMQRLVAYYWPGNVRELENVVERSILLAQGPRVEAADVRIDISERARPATSPIIFCPRA